MDRIEVMWTSKTKVDKMDQIGLNGPNRTEVDQSGQNGPNRTNVDRIKPMWTEWTELGRSE